MDMKWMEPQSRWMTRLLGRDFDAFYDSAKRKTNWLMLLLDIGLVLLLIKLL
jgi:hypothetical protein